MEDLLPLVKMSSPSKRKTVMWTEAPGCCGGDWVTFYLCSLTGNMTGALFRLATLHPIIYTFEDTKLPQRYTNILSHKHISLSRRHIVLDRFFFVAMKCLVRVVRKSPT